MSLNNVTSTLPDPKYIAELERTLASLQAQITNQAASVRTLQTR